MAKRRRVERKRKIQYYSPKRRALYAEGDDISPLILFDLHGWICYVCKGRIDKRLRFPNYMAATVEHIIPLCRGGTHTWDNCAPAHARCNFSKADSLPPRLSGVVVETSDLLCYDEASPSPGLDRTLVPGV